jgi:hypothetical protein
LFVLATLLPFLHPIEEFWEKVKAGISRNALRADVGLTDEICDQSKQEELSSLD